MKNQLLNSQQLFASNLGKLLLYINNNGFECSIGEVERTKYQQKEYVRTGRSKTMNSNHLKRLAADIFIFKNDELINDKNKLYEIGKYWESLHVNNRYGGFFRNFTDVPHFEMLELP